MTDSEWSRNTCDALRLSRLSRIELTGMYDVFVTMRGNCREHRRVRGEVNMWSDGLGQQQEAAAGAARGQLFVNRWTRHRQDIRARRRIQYLVEALGVRPSRIAALTFTRGPPVRCESGLRRGLAYRACGSPRSTPSLSANYSHTVRELSSDQFGSSMIGRSATSLRRNSHVFWVEL